MTQNALKQDGTAEDRCTKVEHCRKTNTSNTQQNLKQETVEGRENWMGKLPLVEETNRAVARLQGRARSRGVKRTQQHSLIATSNCSNTIYKTGTTGSGSEVAVELCCRPSGQEVPHQSVAHSRVGRGGAAASAAHQDLGRPSPHRHSTHRATFPALPPTLPPAPARTTSHTSNAIVTLTLPQSLTREKLY